MSPSPTRKKARKRLGKRAVTNAVPLFTYNSWRCSIYTPGTAQEFRSGSAAAEMKQREDLARKMQ